LAIPFWRTRCTYKADLAVTCTSTEWPAARKSSRTATRNASTVGRDAGCRPRRRTAAAAGAVVAAVAGRSAARRRTARTGVRWR